MRPDLLPENIGKRSALSRRCRRSVPKLIRGRLRQVHRRCPHQKLYPGVPGRFPSRLSRNYPRPHEYRLELLLHSRARLGSDLGTFSLHAPVRVGAAAAECPARRPCAGCGEPTGCRAKPIRRKQEATLPVEPRYLLRDNDGIFGYGVWALLISCGILDVRTA